MPYIEEDRRSYGMVEELAHECVDTIGELNYVITTLCLEFLPSKPSYSDYNAIIGVLECAKLEMYRRAVAPYEDQKIEENGDVYV